MSTRRSPTSNTARVGVVARGRAVVAQRDPDPREQLGHRERLRHEVVGALVERLHLAVLGVLDGEHDDRRRRPLAEAAAQLDAVEVGQPEVEDDRGEVVRHRDVERLAARARGQHAVAARLERGADRAHDRGLVVDDEQQRRVRVSHGAPGG